MRVTTPLFQPVVAALESASTLRPEQIASVCKHLDTVFRSFGADRASTTEATNYLRAQFEAKKDNEAAKPLITELNKVIDAANKRLATEESLSLHQRVEAGELSLGILENSINAIDTAMKSATGNKAGDLNNQRLVFTKIVAKTMATNRSATPFEFEQTLGDELAKAGHFFKQADLATIQNEIKVELSLSKAAQHLTENGILGAAAIAFAGPAAIVAGKEHPMHALAASDRIQSTIDIQTLNATDIDKAYQGAIQKLSSFWNSAPAQEILKAYEVSLPQDGTNEISTRHLSKEQQLMFNTQITSAMMEHVMDPKGAFNDSERAVLKHCALRSAVQQQAPFDIAATIKGLLSGGSLMSSGILGIAGGAIVGPMFGLVVTVMSFLLSSNPNETPRQTPPQPDGQVTTTKNSANNRNSTVAAATT